MMKKFTVFCITFALFLCGCVPASEGETPPPSQTQPDPFNAQVLLEVGFEGDGFDQPDLSGNAKAAYVEGVLNNPAYQEEPVLPYRPQGVRGQSLSFDGYSTRLVYDTDVSGEELTIEAYVCPRAFAWSAPQDPVSEHVPHVIVGSYDEGAKAGFLFGFTKFGHLTFRCGTGDGWYVLADAGHSLKEYEWNRVTAVFDGNAGYMAVYIDGEETANISVPRGSAVASAGVPVAVGAASQPVTEGRYEISRFNGLMDELKIYAGAKNEAEVAAYGQWLTGGSVPQIGYDEARLPDSMLEGDWYRPACHASPPANWMNEPHALFHYNGMWHLFYQYNPVGPYWRNIRWGHWVSEDMVTWQSVRDAVVPTEGSVAPDGIWTGNVVFDGEGRPVLLITAGDDSRPYNNSNQNVALAVAKDYSDPCLTEWEIGDYAVVQTSQMGTAGEFRDAQAFGIGNERYMVVGGASDGRGTAHVFKTTSDALTDWQYMGQLFTPSVYTSEYGTAWEMPNLVPLPYEDGRQSGKYLFVFSPQHGDNDVWYYTGTFDAQTCRFVPDFAEAKRMDFGDNVFTGPTVYTDPQSGRVYICSIMQDQRTDEEHYLAGWAHTAGFPRELFLRADGTLGLKHIDTSPIEGEVLVSFSGLTAAQANERLASVQGNLLKVDFTLTGGSDCGFYLKKKGDEYAKLYFSGGRAGVDTTRFAQQVRGNFSDIFAYGNGISGTVYIDRALIEAYLDGRAAISASCYGRGGGLQVFGDALFTVTVTSLRAI